MPVPQFPIKPIHGTFVFFVEVNADDQTTPTLWGKVKCRKHDLWLMYDPSSGGTHQFDARTGIHKNAWGREYKMAYVGHPNDFNGLTRTEQLEKVRLLIAAAASPAKAVVGRMAPTYCKLFDDRKAVGDYVPQRGDYAFFVDTRAPKELRQMIRVRGRRGDRWWGEQLNGTSNISFSPSTGWANPFGHLLLLAWIASKDELDGVHYNDVRAKIEPGIEAAYASMIRQSLIINPL